MLELTHDQVATIVITDGEFPRKALGPCIVEVYVFQVVVEKCMVRADERNAEKSRGPYRFPPHRKRCVGMKYVGSKSGDLSDGEPYRCRHPHAEIYREPYRGYCLHFIRPANFFLYLHLDLLN